MIRRLLSLLLLAALLIGLSGCTLLEAALVLDAKRHEYLYEGDDYSIFLKEGSGFCRTLETIGVDPSEVTLQFGKDNHEGWLGDGATFIVADLPAFPDLVRTSADWRPLPLSEPLSKSLELFSRDFFDKAGNSLLPDPECGYYCFTDRHSESVDPKDDTDLMQRISFNFTLLILDENTNTLYYIVEDT